MDTSKPGSDSGKPSQDRSMVETLGNQSGKMAPITLRGIYDRLNRLSSNGMQEEWIQVILIDRESWDGLRAEMPRGFDAQSNGTYRVAGILVDYFLNYCQLSAKLYLHSVAGECALTIPRS